jgi:hypothetical protein
VILSALKPCRVALLMVFAALVFLVAVPQGQDVVRALAERQSGSFDDWQRIFFFASVLAWATYAWYWARVMLRLSFPGVPGNDPSLLGLRTWTPRALGTLATLGVAAALYRASLGYAAEEHAPVRELLVLYAWLCLGGAVVFFLLVTFRRELSLLVYRWVRLGIFDVRLSKDEVYGSYGLFELGRATRWFLYAAVGVAVALFLLFVVAPQAAPPLLGTAAIVLLAATCWIAVGSALDFAGMRLRWPVFSSLLALAVLFSPLNDNHAVRTLEAAQPPPSPRQDVRAALRAWLAGQPAKAKRYPLFVVNAEGGGIRAAFWTASVLGELDGMFPQFERQLFSLSGVSGGSLGAAVYVALLAERRAGRSVIVKQKAQAILGEDFLAPVTAAMVYPDLVQRLLPRPVAGFDRALALEEAWEAAWRKHMPGSDRFAEAMDGVRDAKGWAPVLFLNATWVETGKRFIASQVHIVPPEGVDFVDAEDAQRFFASRRLRLSTAVHMSARFTYVSPAGTLTRGKTEHGRVVDGGYFENSGATTTLEILKTVDAMALDGNEDPRWKDVETLVIHISNEPANPTLPPETLDMAAEHPKIGPHNWMNELLSPLWTMLRTRGARGTYARETVYWHVGEDNFFHFGLCLESANAPLGWVLSSSTRSNMANQLAGEICETADTPPRRIFDNRAALERLRARLGG